jgi:hypothetical protein
MLDPILVGLFVFASYLFFVNTVAFINAKIYDICKVILIINGKTENVEFSKVLNLIIIASASFAYIMWYIFARS